jgi:hypothetical protein
MTCEELNAKLNSQKAALLKLQAEEMTYYAILRFDRDADSFANQTSNLGAYSDYLEAKSAYERASRLYSAAARGVRG